MGPGRFPAVGAQARRRADGILGEVYASDPPHDLLSVRWATIPGAYAREDCTLDQFSRSWELTGLRVPPPRETHVAVGLIGLLVLLFLGGILLHDFLYRYQAYEFLRPAAGDPPSRLNNARSLDQKYGLQAAETCANGADDYIRSITSHLFRWDGMQSFEPRFDRFSPTVTTPGVLTMISGKARVSDGFGTFNPVTIYCNYDTQSREVLSYGSDSFRP